MQDSNLARDPFLDEALKQDPDLYIQSAEKAKSTLDDWRAGRIPSLTDALREQLDLGALPAPDFTSLQLACPLLETDATASTSFGRYLGQPSRAGQSLATVTELGLPLHGDPSDDMLDQDSSPPLGIMPVFHRGMIRAAMRPTKARVLSRPGRGPVPLPISVHPQARPFGVAQSSLALREAAQLRAKDPTARQLVSRRHGPPRLDPPPKPEPCLPEGFEMPEKLPSPETAVTLLAQANRAHQRYLNLSKQPQNASQFAPPAVLGADAATAGTAGDFIKDHPLINPRANSAAAPQAIAATAASAAAPTAAAGLPSMGAQRLAVDQQLATHAAQPVTSSAQAPPQAAAAAPAAAAAAAAAAAPPATLPAGSATPPAAAAADPSSLAASIAEEFAAATADSIDDESVGLQNGKAIKQRPGQKQRKRQRELAELKKVEDDAKAIAEGVANKKAEAEAKAKQEAEAKAAAAEKEAEAAEAAAMAETKKAEEAMAKEAATAREEAEAASMKAAAELLASEEAAVQGKEFKMNCCCTHCTTAQHAQWSM